MPGSEQSDPVESMRQRSLGLGTSGTIAARVTADLRPVREALGDLG
jgi:hypothetical protein